MPRSQPTSGPLWARIVLDAKFSSNGAIWGAAEYIHKLLGEFGVGREPDELLAMDAVAGAGLSVAEFRGKYGEGKIEKKTGGRDDGITYYVHGPIGLGFKPGDSKFTWLRAPAPVFQQGFVKAALRAQGKPGAPKTTPSAEGTSGKGATAQREARILALLGNAKNANWIYKVGRHSGRGADAVRKYVTENAGKLFDQPLKDALAPFARSVGAVDRNVALDVEVSRPQKLDSIRQTVGKEDSVSKPTKEDAHAWYRYGWIELGVVDGEVRRVRVDCKAK